MYPLPDDAYELLAEAAAMARALKKVQPEIRQRGLDVIALLERQLKETDYERTQDLYRAVLNRHTQFGRAAQHVSVDADAVLHLYRPKDYADPIESIMASLPIENVDKAKLAHPELLVEMLRARETVFRAPRSWASQVASVHILAYSASYFYDGTVSAFLGRPSLMKWAAGTAIKLMKAAAADMVGTAIPFFGTAVAAADLFKPRFKRESAELRRATEQLDRLFKLDDQLAGLASYAQQAQATAGLVRPNLELEYSEFKRDADWLLAVMQSLRELGT